jgi:hypothetical protein
MREVHVSRLRFAGDILGTELTYSQEIMKEYWTKGSSWTLV